LAGRGGGGGGGWRPPAPPTDVDAVTVALHRALAATPSRLLGVALTDVVGDRRAMNQPGTDDEYPNWRLPLADGTGSPVLLDDLVSVPLAGRLADAVVGRDGPGTEAPGGRPN
jgi:4-alpha-glucanotransferase